jgi:hypothetical protein
VTLLAILVSRATQCTDPSLAESFSDEKQGIGGSEVRDLKSEGKLRRKN